MSNDDTAWPAPFISTPVRATVSVPGSKSLTNRYLVLAAIATDESYIAAPLLSRDTSLMMDALTSLGAGITRRDDGGLLVRPIDLAGTAPTDPALVHCGLAGTVMRFVPPIAALTRRPVRFDGDVQAYARPMGPVLDSLRSLGVEVEAGRETLPFDLHAARGVRGGHVALDASTSSQFVSALLLAGSAFDLGVEIEHTGTSLPSMPHIEMTLEVLADAGVHVSRGEGHRWIVEPGRPRGLEVTVEPDLSNAATFVAGALVSGSTVSIPHWPSHTTQAGDAIRGIAEAFGGTVELDRHTLTVTGPRTLLGVDLDLGDVGELTPVVAAVAACSPAPSRLRGIGHLRGHETDRLHALSTELRKSGAEVTEGEDFLEIDSPVDRGAEWDTYHDHRMVMAAAVVGLRVPDTRIRDVATVGKTMPDFTTLWSDMLTGSGVRTA